MSPPVSDTLRYQRREVLATAGGGFAVGLTGCGYSEQAGGSEPSLQSESVKVGVLALAPEEYPVSLSVVNGAEMAATRINADGGVAGASLELVVGSYDRTNDIPEEHQRLCEDEGCDLTVGLVTPGTARDILPSIAEQETIHLTTGSFDTRPGERIGEDYDAFKYHFRPGLPNYLDLADALSTWVIDNSDTYGWERIGIQTPNLEEITPFFERLRENISGHLAVPYADQKAELGDYRPRLEEVADAGCDVLLTGYPFGSQMLVSQWAAGEYPFALGGLQSQAMSPTFWKDIEGDVESVFTLDGFTPTSDNTGRTRAFVADYQNRYGRPPAYAGGLTYDALRIYRAAVENVVSSGDNDLPNDERLIDALEALTFSDGVVYPEFEFTGPNATRVHEPVWESMSETGVPVVKQWRVINGEGVMKAIAPEQHSTATYQHPPWFNQ